ncbi:hypothetical protein DL98DRAFT_657931 [Cadophora sp. DSE1049]|nr:hypothetical protein DL98DRAFT_657931 [Cadophora sp. DSE1049]
MDTSSSTEMEPNNPRTFTKFPDLPTELQDLIIGIAAGEAHHSAPGVTRIYRSEKKAKLCFPGTRSDRKRLFCMVNHHFKDEYAKGYPLRFALHREGKEIAPARVPFNFDTDQLVITQNLLELPPWYEVPDLKKVKRLIILWKESWRLREMPDICVGRLIDMPLSSFKERAGGYIALLRERSFQPKHLAALPKYGNFSGLFNYDETLACDFLVMRLCHHPIRGRNFSYGLAVWSMRLRFDLVDTNSPTAQSELSEVVKETEATEIVEGLIELQMAKLRTTQASENPLET